MNLANVSLDDKYALKNGRIFLNGIQALVRLPMMQRQRDLAAGLNTAGFISGYRGSPLGGVDQALWSTKGFLKEQHIEFQPGLNEDLAATSVWGTQQVNLFPGAKYDGVFAMWYGKGPGVDRSGDVFRHANAAGTSLHGGVLVIAGDDHAAKSSTLPHQTEHVFKALMMPVLAPSGVQEYLDYGLHGWALSRYSGCWVAFKALADTVESSASVDVSPERVQIVMPKDFDLPPDGLNIRWPDPPLVQEARLLNYKLYAALAYCRANRLDRIVMDAPEARLGIITCGKSYLDVRQAMDDLGIDEELAAEIGIRLYKVGMVWPLEAEGVRHFAEGLDEILVVEEKRQMLEYQLKEELYNWRENVRPRVIGKFDEKGEWALLQQGDGIVWHGEWLLPAAGDLTPAMIARVIAQRIGRVFTSKKIEARLAFLEAKEKALARPRFTIARTPHYCSGCPHNSSTRVPEGSRVLAGIGCHYMATWLSPETTKTFTQMGGEGATWIGQAPFTSTEHVFANLGDGTYFHSGVLAIRAAVAAKTRITYKILYNDAVAMTGGQPVDGILNVPQLTRQLAAEGVRKIVIVTDDPDKYRPVQDLAPGTPVRHRDELDAVQRELREYVGVSVLIYDQTCAAEKRRRRKRGRMVDPARRVFINEAVCEGCGDCSEQSNCMSVIPVETEFGRKREIDQSSCNKDFTCIKGFCPSFVTIEGGSLKKGKALATGHEQEERDEQAWHLPTPTLPALDSPYGIMVTGVGGTGVVTIGALLGMAAHLEGKGVSVLDMAGLAQKGGAVWSHIRIAAAPEQIYASRIAAGEANLVIGCDIVVAVNDESLAKMQTGLTQAVINSNLSITSEMVRTFAAQARSGDLARYHDPQFPVDAMEQQVVDAVGEGRADFLDATRLATRLLGDSIATNLFMLGYAWQKGMIPVSAEAIVKAIELNGTAAESNKKSFLWGRRAAHDLATVERIATPQETLPQGRQLSVNLDEIIARRVKMLTDYQDAAYALRYTKLLDRVQQAETAIAPGQTAFTEAVARAYCKLLAYKDEYEVARLYSDGEFMKRIRETFADDYRLNFHLAPPLLAKTDPQTGELQKRSYGPWMLRAFTLLAKLRGLRGTAFDPFARSAERQQDRQSIAHYERVIDELLAGLCASNLPEAVEIAGLPLQVRGYGHIRARHLEQVRQRESTLLEHFHKGETAPRPHAGRMKESVVVIPG